MSAVGRRTLLRGTASVGGLGLLGGPLARGARTRTFVLVHGSNGNAGVWSAVAAELAQRGHRVCAVNLPGHGPGGFFPASYQAPQDLAAFAAAPSPLAQVTLAANVTHVTAAVRRLAPHGPVVLAGQSLGGITITKVADAVPHLLARLVYISAFCCTAQPTVYDTYRTPEGAPSLVLNLPKVGDPAQTGALRTNWRSADPAFLATAKAAFLADGTDERLRAILAECEPDEAAILSFTDARPDPARWGSVPRTFVRLTADRAVPLPLQDRMIREADALTPRNRFRTASLPSSHLGFLDRPAPVADLLESEPA
ncbi:alpha/beta fold hydrolase [Nonomuraea sp. NPDC049695]|uniref:alpha/beta fold hydrolase n=1 Tax=Nonomuraea sp. NPDC049695 TaxID=3154734 RepID=UPI00342181D4